MDENRVEDYLSVHLNIQNMNMISNMQFIDWVIHSVVWIVLHSFD